MVSNYNFIPVEGGVPIKAWTKGVPVDPQAAQQLRNVAALPFVFRHVAVMPDVHGGKGEPESFCSCSHGAGRVMSRTQALKRFTVDDHARATAHVECRKDEGVLDETPAAYKDIDAVMAAQADLVEVVHTLRQVVCVKG